MDHERKASKRWRSLASPLAALGIMVGALALSACGAEPERTAELGGPIAGGSLDFAHSNVFLLVGRHRESASLCTATLLAPNLLLTARHCVSPASHDVVRCGEADLGEPYPASVFIATNDPQPNDDSPVFGALRIEVPDEGTDTCGFDVALVVLEQAVPAEVAVPAVPRIDREVEPGERYTAVGYGVDGSGKPSGARMQLSGLSVACGPGECGSVAVKDTEFLGQDGVCSGDSGGPAIDDDGKVVGVVSRGGPECTTPIYGSIAGWSRFIIEVAHQAAELGGYEPPFWATSGRSDPPLVPSDDGSPGEAGSAGASNSSETGLGGAGGDSAQPCTVGAASCVEPETRPKLRDSSCAVANLAPAGPAAPGAWAWLLAAACVWRARRPRAPR